MFHIAGIRRSRRLPARWSGGGRNDHGRKCVIIPSDGMRHWRGQIDWDHNSLGRDSMLRYMKSTVYAVAAAAAFAAMVAIPAIAQDKQPIKIGFGMAETGPLGPNGKSALL